MLNYDQKYRHSIRMEIFHLLGDKCCRCGFSDWRALQIDHINGGGTKELRSRHGTYRYTYILNRIKCGSKDYQLLCANCNWIKRVENHENGIDKMVRVKVVRGKVKVRF